MTDSAPSSPLPLGNLEHVFAIDECGFWLTGWIHSAEPRDTQLTAVSPEGVRRRLLPGTITFHPRDNDAQALPEDGSTLGFHAYVELEQPSRVPTDWRLELRAADGAVVEAVAVEPVLTDAAKVRDLAIEQIRGESPDEAVFAGLVLPALTRLRGGTTEAVIDKTFEFGLVPSAPEISIVVAVRRVDRIEHQLAQFVRDPEISSTEVIFVAPRIGAGDELAAIAEELQLLYGFPFRVMQLSRPARGSRALNLGASVARGSYLVLMSGDVVPRAPGWAFAMRTFYDSSALIAAVGPKLLAEDDSIAHAGVEYVCRGWPARWLRTLEFKGLAQNLPAASFPRPVDAVSDACMMVEAERFNAVDGFSEVYLGPGDEAGDLCMRLAEADGEIWYVPEAELYNLDRPDSPPNRSPAATRFNDWLFTTRWAARLGWNEARAPIEVVDTT